ncbi:DciA family protein [Acerihabitans sp. KWT182]|uniref:DciA family protein n=1 Tax=Acerihabitans sp. KWT182 TaxID=3157919 RepID=A0AAU7QBC1_9GAMM
MRDSRPQSIDILLGSLTTPERSSLRHIQQRAEALLKLNRAVAGILPAPLKPWCRVANFRQGILILETANASWMMRLRYEQSSLLSALRAQILPSLSSIDIRINPTLATKGHQIIQNQGKPLSPGGGQFEGKKRKLSPQSGETIRHLAARSPEKLKEMLERLAKLAGDSADPANRND